MANEPAAVPIDGISASALVNSQLMVAEESGQFCGRTVSTPANWVCFNGYSSDKQAHERAPDFQLFCIRKREQNWRMAVRSLGTS